MGKHASRTVSAALAAATAFGILSGLGGITHGVGEILQGAVAPAAAVFNSWAQGPIATNMGGEPAMTLVPNLQITGVLTIAMSLAMIVWSSAFVSRRYGGLVQILLSIAMLLVGAGFAPPIIGMLAGVAGLGIGAPHMWLREHLPAGMWRVVGRMWPWLFGVCLLNGVFLVIGSVILVYGFGLNSPGLFVGSFLLAVASLLVTLPVGVAYDIRSAPTV